MKTSSNFRRFFGILLVAAALAACSSSPPKPQTPEQAAFALYGAYVVAQETASRVVGDPLAPEGIKEKLVQLNAEARPYADLLFNSVQSLRELREAGENTDDAVAALNAAFESARPHIIAFLLFLRDTDNGTSDPSRNIP